MGTFGAENFRILFSHKDFLRLILIYDNHYNALKEFLCAFIEFNLLNYGLHVFFFLSTGYMQQNVRDKCRNGLRKSVTLICQHA